MKPFLYIFSSIIAALLLAVIGLAASALTACSLIGKPNNTVAFTSNQIVALAERVEQAQAIGALSEVEGDRYLAALLKANSLLIDSKALVTDIEGCEATDTRLQCIDKVLAQVEQAL